MNANSNLWHRLNKLERVTVDPRSMLAIGPYPEPKTIDFGAVNCLSREAWDTMDSDRQQLLLEACRRYFPTWNGEEYRTLNKAAREK